MSVYSLFNSRITRLVISNTRFSLWPLNRNKFVNKLIPWINNSQNSIICCQSSLRMMKEAPKIRLHAINIMNGNYDELDRKDATDTADYDDEEFDLDAKDSVDKDKNNLGIYDTFDQDPNETDDDDELAASVLEMERSREAEKQRRLAAAQPLERVQEIDEKGRAYGRGGRKTATARVWVQPGEGLLTINRREFLDYFPRDSDREIILSPFVATNTCGNFDVTVAVEGGGVTGKAGAIRHGIARALEKYNPEYRPALKRLGFLTRDARTVERKKVGHKKARKKPQWVRR